MWWNIHKSFALAIAIGTGSFLLLFVAIMPIYRSASELLGKIKTKSAELEEMTSRVTILSKLDPSVLLERVSVLDSALPPKKDVLLYLSSIDGLSQELGLTFGGLSLSPGELSAASGSATKKAAAPEAVTSGLQSLETEITIRGGQDGIYTFLRTIETVLPLMQIKDVTVTVIGQDQYTLTLTLAMLWSEPSTLDLKGKVTLFGDKEEKYFAQLSQYRRFESIVNPEPSQGDKQDLFAPTVITPQP